MVAMAATVLRLGWTDPRTGVFGAHPRLGGPLDLNDGVTFTLLDGGLALEPPPRELALAGNARTRGERAVRALYRHNRRATVRLALGPMGAFSDLAAVIRALVAWVDAPPAEPVTLQWQAPGAASPVYLDVAGAACGIPADERDWLRLQIEPVELAFVTRPGLRGDRVWLQNLVMNPGFEAPSGPGVQVFSDPFASADAYTVLNGAAPGVASGVMTIPTDGIVTFGSPAWDAVNRWRVRFQWVSGLQATFCLHYTDYANRLQAKADGGTLYLEEIIGGGYHLLASTAAALAGGSWYWLEMTQFPGAPGNPPLLQATLYADSAGSIGSPVAGVGPVATADAVTALAGKAALYAAAAPMAVSVNTVALFGPGGWLAADYLPDATYAPGGYAWERDSASAYPGGPVASYGAARIDLPPAGFYNTSWQTGDATSLATLQRTAIPVREPGDTLALSLAYRAAGLTADAMVAVNAIHYDSGGAPLATTSSVASHAGSTTGATGWITLSGSWATPAGCAYVALQINLYNTTVAGEDAGGVVWLDNVQCWDETATGQAGMPYCELRFPQSPAQLLVSGLLGDLPAPAAALVGAYLASWPQGSSLTWALARRGSASAAAALVGGSDGYQPANSGGVTPVTSAALDTDSYGGYYLATTLGGGFNPRAFSFAPDDLLGTYHLFGRFWSAQASGDLPNVQTRVVTQQRAQPWFGASDLSDQTGQYNGPWSAPLAASSTWTLADAGQVNVPALPAGALSDLTQGYLTPRAQWQDISASGATFRANWQALLPVDGSLLLGVANNPANGPFAVSGSWLWLYADGLLAARGGPAVTLSIEAAALADPARGSGGPGTQSSGSIGVNSGADPYLTLDPTIICAPGAGGMGAGGAGVNQLTALLADGAGAVPPVACDLVYTPLYLYPR